MVCAAGAYVVRIPTPPARATPRPATRTTRWTTRPRRRSCWRPATCSSTPTSATSRAGTFGSIGDTVWLDANRNNTKDAGEPRLPGVTVALIKDLDGDGIWDAGEPIIATDITDENGVYGFTGLPVTDGAGTDDYLVWVNDTNSALHELAPPTMCAMRGARATRPPASYRPGDQRGDEPDTARRSPMPTSLRAARP